MGRNVIKASKDLPRPVKVPMSQTTWYPEIAQAWADERNKIYGRGTHWVEVVPTEERRP